MPNKKDEMILLIVSDVILIFCTILFYYFAIKNNVNDVKSVVTENADGSTTIYIFHSINWKNIIMYLIFVITINLVIVTIIKFIRSGV
jgi:succinate dehydrogenase hydrophobic anchor subunit